MLSRLNSGLAVPHGVESILDRAPAVDAGPIADLAMNLTGKHANAHAVLRVIGPITIGKLIDRLLVLAARLRGQPRDQTLNDEYQAVEGAVRATRQESFLTALLDRAGATDIHCVSILAKLVHLHGEDGSKEPMVLSPEVHGRLVATLTHWGELLLAAPGATRHEIVSVVYAIGRVPASECVTLVARMLQRDLEEEAREREEWKRGVRGGVRRSYDNWYGLAFSAIGDAHMSALMIEYLPDLQFGCEAARVLYEIWNQTQPATERRGMPVWYDYTGVKNRREQAREAPQTSSPSAESIWEAVRSCGKQGESAERQRHAVALACIAMRMPLGVHRADIAGLLSLPLPCWDKRDLFVVAAMAGIELSAESLAAAVRELLNAARTESWRLDESNGELMTWMELFAFSNRPAAVLDCLNLLPTERRTPHRLRRVVDALGNSPHPGALAVLKALTEHGPKPDQDDWLTALEAVGTADAGQVILEAACNGALSGRRHTLRHNVAELLATFARSHAACRKAVVERCADATDHKAWAVLKETLIQLGDEEALLAVMQGMAQRGEELGHQLSEAIHELAIGESPSAQWANAVERFSVPLTAFRKKLFALLADDKQSMLAHGCLEEIDRARDEYGRIPDEPRHPDITSAKPWPIV